MITFPFILTSVLQEYICSSNALAIFPVKGEEPVFRSVVCCSITAEIACLFTTEQDNVT